MERSPVAEKIAESAKKNSYNVYSLSRIKQQKGSRCGAGFRSGSRVGLQHLSGFRVDAIVENGRVQPVGFRNFDPKDQ